MLTVLIEDRRNPESLVRTLSSLVPAIAEGVVRDGMVLCANPAPEIVRIADSAGCEIVGGREGAALRAALARARADHVLLLRAGTVLESDWWIDAARFVERNRLAGPRAAVFSLAAGGYGLPARLSELCCALRSDLLGRIDPRQGLVAPVSLLRGAAKGDDAFPPRFGGRPVRLRARAFAAG